MPPSSLRILIAIFLIAHGLVHYSLATVPVPAPGALRTPFFPAWWRTAVDPLWPILRAGINPETARTVGWVLWVVQLICFSLAGLGLLGIPGLSVVWRGLALFGAASSLFLLGLFWHPWLVVGVLIDLAIIAGYIWNWPSFLFTK